ncbi:MAG: SpoIIE family protein phosphatase [Eubacteriales bacterium]
METFAKMKERINRFGEKANRFVTAIGGKIEGMSPLPADQTAAIRRRAFYCAAFTVLGFLFESTTAVFGSRPYGIALLICGGHANTVFIWLGELAGVIASGGMILPRLVILTLILATRYALSGGVFFDADCTTFGEPLKLRLILSGIFAFLMGICTVLTDGLSTDSLLALILGIILSPLLCAAFTFAFDKSAHATLHEAGILLLLFVLISSLDNGSVPGLSFALILSFLLILHTGMGAGMLRGTLVGLICGIACGEYGVILALAGLACGALIPFGVGTSVFVSAALAIGVAIYSGAPNLIHFTGDVIFSSLLMLPLCKAGILKKLRLFGKDPEAVVWLTDPAAEKSMAEDRKRRLSALSTAFDEISEVLQKLSADLRNPKSGEMRRICDEVFDRTCRRCALSSICWQAGYEETSASVDELAKSLCEKSTLAYEDLPEHLRRRCRHADRILREINRGRAELIEAAITKDKTDLFAMDYAAIAELLRENSESDTEETRRFAPDSALRAKAEEVIRLLGISYVSVGAFGNRQKSVVVSGVEVASVTVSGRQIASELSREVGMVFGDPDFRFRGDFVVMTLSTLPRYKLAASGSSQPRKGESVCGDQIRTFYGSGSYAYALICDGMGSGSDASASAEIGAIFLQKMLAAGNSRSVSIKLLSSLLCSRSVECHTTVDLLEVDLFTGKAIFQKSGAAPSYLYRKGKLFKVESKTMPVGVVKDAAPEETPVDLLRGDLVVMVSDGIGGIENAQWLPDLIAKGAKDSTADLASAIRARAAVENHACDDISVIVARVE